MNIVFVTSFGESYYEHIASRTLPLMVKATKGYQLEVYYENSILLQSNINPEHVRYHNLYHCSDDLRDTLAQMQGMPLYEGREYRDSEANVWSLEMREANYNYRLNAYAFCRKWFAIEHAFRRLMTK